MSSFVEIDNVTHAYGGQGGVIAVDKLTLSIAEGEFAAVVGPSGCGKSTLMKLVTGLQLPQVGSIRVGGAKVVGPLKIAGMAAAHNISTANGGAWGFHNMHLQAGVANGTPSIRCSPS